jgi:hypothetical protein
MKKLSNRYIWSRLLYERFSEPLHMNFLSLFVLLLGNLRQNIRPVPTVLEQNQLIAVLR